MPAEVLIFRTQFCGYCVRAKVLLEKKGAPFREIDVSNDRERRSWLADVTGRRTVPQIFINGRHIGGFHELANLEKRGELDALLSEEPEPLTVGRPRP
jgi:glutaredoxin 3